MLVSDVNDADTLQHKMIRKKKSCLREMQEEKDKARQKKMCV